MFLVATFFCVLIGTAQAQTLARPNWAGSGLSSEAWWRNAVFYRVNAIDFQDSDGNGEGDLRGLAQRLNYVQSLGADALVLEAPADDSGFDDLLEESGRHHIRLLVTVSGSDGATLLPRARQWLTRGAAGVWYRPASGESPALLEGEVHALRSLADGFPGGRILVADTSHETATVPVAGAELVVRALQIGTLGQGDDASLLQVQLRNAQDVPQGSVPLIALQEETPQSSGAAEMRKIAAAALFASRSAVVLEAGQEIGLNAAHDNARRLMHWTPSNITRPPAVPVEKPKPTARREDDYGAFVPYVPPAAETVKHGPDFDAEQGFTTGKLPANAAVNSTADVNVAMEEADPASLLNFVRKLAQLHHGKTAVRAGAVDILDHANEGVLVVLRRPPSGDRLATPVFIACNLGGQRTTVSLKDDLAKLKVRGGYLKPLLASPPGEVRVPQSTDSLVLAPLGVVIAEVEYE